MLLLCPSVDHLENVSLYDIFISDTAAVVSCNFNQRLPFFSIDTYLPTYLIILKCIISKGKVGKSLRSRYRLDLMGLSVCLLSYHTFFMDGWMDGMDGSLSGDMGWRL